MEDNQIVDLYWRRDENAIRETNGKYGRMLKQTSFSIVRTDADAEECLNDTYLAAWNSMPENRPEYLGAYLAKIIRGLSINRYRMNHSKKRSNNGFAAEELTDCIADKSDVVAQLEAKELSGIINDFVSGLDYEKRYVFIRRYFYSDSIEQISVRTGFSVTKLKSMLLRLRRSLKEILEEEGRV